MKKLIAVFLLVVLTVAVGGCASTALMETDYPQVQHRDAAGHFR